MNTEPRFFTGLSHEGPRKPATAAAGFTFLEVMAAVAILAIAMVILIRSQTQSLTSVIKVQNYERGVFITENQLHWTYLDLNEAADWTEYQSLSGEDGDYRWSVSLTPVQQEQEGEQDVVLLRVVATTIWPEGGSDAEFSLETLYLWGRGE